VGGTLGRVLVVDDSEVIRQLITVNLELEGFEVVTAVDGEDCLDKVVDVDPQVVTLDVIMPRLDGFRTAARLRQDARTAGLKIVLITACAQDGDFQRGRDLGVDAYLTKPFEPADLLRTVRVLAGHAPEPEGPCRRGRASSA
jgi:CheY-like chemotaxis protein